MEQIPHIYISHEDAHTLLEDVANNFVKNINSAGLDVQSGSRPQLGPLMCIEWYIPTALIIFMSKAYFDSFLKEMGKDHYHAFKSGMSQIWEKLFSKNKVLKYQLIGTSGKLTENYKYSLEFSLVGEITEGKSFKFLFENDIEENAFIDRTELILDFLNTFHTNQERFSEYFAYNENTTSDKTTVLIAYDKKSGKLTNLDPRQKHTG